MPKNIEIQIKDEIYERLKDESAKYNMDIKNYIPMVIEKYDDSARRNNNYIEEKVKKPLKKILTDLEGLSENMNDNRNLNKILLLPLKIYTKPLPKGLIKLIEHYKSKFWYDIERFYLITDGKSILGYVGLNISEEDAPYGKYLFIYALNLYKEYQTSTNLKYIINFIQSIGRQGQCYSIDILFENSNLTYDQLKGLGFLLLTSTDIIRIKELNYDKISMDYLKTRKINIEDMEDFLPVARTEPFKPLYNQWLERKENIEVYSNIYRDEGEEIEFIYTKEDKWINNNLYDYFILLIRKKYIYEDKYINKAILILKFIILNNIEKDSNLVISISKHLNENKSIYKDDEILDSLNWLRKNNG